MLKTGEPDGNTILIEIEMTFGQAEEDRLPASGFQGFAQSFSVPAGIVRDDGNPAFSHRSFGPTRPHPERLRGS